MRYFLVNGFRPSAHPPKMERNGYCDINFNPIVGETRRRQIRRYREAGVDVPNLGESTFLRRPSVGRISLFVHGAYDAFIMVVAPSQKKAYLLGTGLRAALTSFHGHPPLENESGYLLELTKPPSEDMTLHDLTDLINLPLFQVGGRKLFLERELKSGTLINHIKLSQACEVVGKALDRVRLLDALMHLENSRNLVWGFMVGSFYECHYKRDRKELTQYQLERSYLENRFRYDSSFVSAFRGIECVLGKPHFKRGEISTLLSMVDVEFGTSFCSSKHRSWHEMFSSRRKWWKYEDLIAHYLKLRNAVSAHGNPSPPHIVMEDQVFEIQYLLQAMLADILVPEEEMERTEPKDIGGD